MKYDPKKIEKKWQKLWLEEKTFRARDDSKKSKYYQLETFPYPSAEGLHVGHPKGYIAEDIHARYMRMKGYEVLYTMGWDAFGLPTENYAIKVGKSPRDVAEANVKNFKRQVQMFGLSYDWDRETNTSSPEYYKWTQWLFIQLFKNGLAYRAKAKVNWCPKDQTVLANEQVVNGKCERDGAEVEQREMEQWFFKITDYAERLLADLWAPSGTNFLILHGFTGHATTNFIPWLKTELEKMSYPVQAPELPNTDNPSESEQVKYVLANCKIDENTIIIGHSLGGFMAMKMLLELDHSIGGLILVASAMDPSFPSDWDEEEKPFWKNMNWNFDYERIKVLARSRIILSDLQEKGRIPYMEFLAKEINAKLVTGVANKEHFCALEEPIILENVLPCLDWPASTIKRQEDWIGRSEGALIKFEIRNSKFEIPAFTTRPDTLFGATYMVLASEHSLIENLKLKIENWPEVQKYIEQAKHKTELMRQEEAKDKTGIELKGIKAINPATKEEIPIWVADYVLMGYGTGAIMAVPAHDERDFEFAKKFNLPIREVIIPKVVDRHDPPRAGVKTVERTMIQAVVINPKNGKILALKWKKLPWTTFITGGIDNHEDVLEGAKREIIEETGYKNISFVRYLGGPTESHYYANHKGENRKALFYNLVFQVDSEEKGEVSPKEKEIHETEWITWEELAKDKNTKSSEYEIILDRFFNSPHAFTETGILWDSGKFTGMDSEKAKWEIVKFVHGEKKIQYKLRDWSVSRQRYWGVPIPMIHCPKCGIVPVPEKDLPVELPPLKDYRPKGMPPLAGAKDFIETKCPKCGGKAERSAETLDTFVDSSWYYLRYADPRNSKEIFDKKKAAHWLPVDLYVIGAEHTVLHLLYSRFITKFLHDEGWLKFNEPFLKLRHQGLILGEDGRKMSKSKGNVVNPDPLIEEFGADTVRLYEMFMGPFEDGAPWDPKGILGAERFLRRAWAYMNRAIDMQKKPSGKVPTPGPIEPLIHRAVKKVGEDIGNFKFNTAISALMILFNSLYRVDEKGIIVWFAEPKHLEMIVKILHPFAPHMAQELWEMLGHKTFLDFEPWPEYDPKLIQEEKFTLVIQVNGKVRDSAEVHSEISEAEVKELALSREKIKNILGAQKPKKVIYVPKKIINIVT